MFASMIGSGEMMMLFVVLLLIPISLAAFAFWIWMLVHAIQSKGLTDGEKAGWVLAIALVHFPGALLYFFIGRPKARQLTAPAGTLTA